MSGSLLSSTSPSTTPRSSGGVVHRVTPNVGFDMYPAGKMRGIPTEVHDDTLTTKFDTVIKEEVTCDTES